MYLQPQSGHLGRFELAVYVSYSFRQDWHVSMMKTEEQKREQKCARALEVQVQNLFPIISTIFYWPKQVTRQPRVQGWPRDPSSQWEELYHRQNCPHSHHKECGHRKGIGLGTFLKAVSLAFRVWYNFNVFSLHPPKHTFLSWKPVLGKSSEKHIHREMNAS